MYNCTYSTVRVLCCNISGVQHKCIEWAFAMPMLVHFNLDLGSRLLHIKVKLLLLNTRSTARGWKYVSSRVVYREREHVLIFYGHLNCTHWCIGCRALNRNIYRNPFRILNLNATQRTIAVNQNYWRIRFDTQRASESPIAFLN